MPKDASPVSRLTLPPRTMLRDTVYESIKAMLMDNDLTPGSRLSIDAIARTLEVSPTPVREAMTKLEADGLVAKRPHAGFVVAPLMDEASLGNLFDIRLLLEPGAAARAAENANRKQLSEMHKLLGSMRVVPAGETYEDYRDFAVQDAHLHRLVAEASGNPLIVDALNRLHAHTHSYRLYFKIGITAETTQEHQLLFDMIEARDPAKAEAAMRDHIQSSQDRLRAAYEEQIP